MRWKERACVERHRNRAARTQGGKRADRNKSSVSFPGTLFSRATAPAPRPRGQVSLLQTSPGPRLLPTMSRPGVPVPVPRTCTHMHCPAHPDTSTSAHLSPERTTCPPASRSRVQLRPSQLITRPVFHLQPPQIQRHWPAPKSRLSHLS